MTARAVVLAVLADMIGPVTDATRLGDHLDSMGRVYLILELEDALGCEMPRDAEFAWETVADVVKAAEEAVKK